MSRQPRVLVTDAEHRSVLATCRGLGAAGYRVSTIAGSRLALGHWSRFSDERITFAGPSEDAERYVERLVQVLRRGGYDVLVPGAEPSLLAISQWRDAIEPHVHLGLPDHKVLHRALDKSLLLGHAASVGLAPPRSVTCSTIDEALAVAARFPFPLIVKPTRSFVLTQGRRFVERLKGRVVTDATRLEAALAAVGAPLVIQEYTPRAAIVSYAGVRIGDELLGLTVARYVRTYPKLIGSAALAVTVAPAPRLTQQVEELIRLTGWCGIFELELLEFGDSRCGAIDFNPRPFGWMQLATGAGANLPAVWCDHVLGRRSVSTAAARPGVYYRWEDADLRNTLACLGEARFRDAAAVLRPRRGTVHALFKWDDPAPLLARLLMGARKLGPRHWRAGAERDPGGHALGPRADGERRPIAAAHDAGQQAG